MAKPPDAQDRGRDDGGLTEAIAPAHGDNAKDADGQVGDADLELEGITGRPADGLRDRVRKEEVAEEPTDSASGDTDPKEIQQEDLQPALAGPTTPVQTEMSNSDEGRQDGEGEDADRDTVHAVPSSSDIVWMPRSHVIAGGAHADVVAGDRAGLAESSAVWAETWKTMSVPGSR